VHATSMVRRTITGLKSDCNVVSWCRVKANKVVKLMDQQSQLMTIGIAPATKGQYVVVPCTAFDDHFSSAYIHPYTVHPSTSKIRIHPAYLLYYYWLWVNRASLAQLPAQALRSLLPCSKTEYQRKLLSKLNILGGVSIRRV